MEGRARTGPEGARGHLVLRGAGRRSAAVKLMFGVESVNDVVAYRGLISAILRREIDIGEIRLLRPHRPEAAATFVREAHRLGVSGVVLAIDNDGVEILHEAHEPPSNAECRHCLLLKVARIEDVRAWPRPA